MMVAPAMPLWPALLVSSLLLAGAAITLIGCLGLLRLKTFYARVHAPTLGATLGTGCILIASMVSVAVLQDRTPMHEVLIAVLVTVTTPVTLMLLSRASLHRDRVEGSTDVPASDDLKAGDDSRAV